MRIAILSRNPRLYSTQRLVEAARARGHEVVVMDVLRCFMAIARDQPTLFYNGVPVPDFDAVIPRIGASVTYYGTTVLRQLEMMGVVSLNSSLSISRSRDKLRSLQVLSRSGVGLPITGYAHAAADIPDLIDLVGGPPLVVKVLEGTQG
ncbi:MAG TPA: 30S ribosomal protein S6--L-glutamate ligase, partial [Pseudomonadales bacterium]|nr:30S ribosomal protein S6--L-glutamate ligase [Pseudomonadales bacterium]